VATYRLLEARFARAVDERDVDDAVAAILELEGAIVSWSSDSLQSDEADQARAVLRVMILRLGELAQVGPRDPEEVLGPFIEAVVEARAAARERKDWAGADALRDRLIDAGVEISDTPEGTDWSLLT
jgi:cysteinyl-tRNA synthetase